MELIKAFCPKDGEGHYNGTILDPFHGSGTLGVCCEKLNAEGHHIKWLGIELEQQWCDIAEQRIADIENNFRILNLVDLCKKGHLERWPFCCIIKY